MESSLLLKPIEVIRYDRNRAELEEFLLFAIMVAGKNADQTAVKHTAFINAICDFDRYETPFEAIRALMNVNPTLLSDLLWWLGIGKYKMMMDCFSHLAKHEIDLMACSLGELEQIPGVSLKSSRFFVLFNREGARVACLDTHILAEIRELGYAAPRATPQSKKRYAELEQIWLAHCDALHTSPADYDLQVWKRRSGRDRALADAA